MLFLLSEILNYQGSTHLFGVGSFSFIDNYSAGGLVCSVDLETGITKENAENYLGMRFSNHPVTGVALEGFEIPKLEHKSKGSTQDSYQMILCHGDGFD